MILKMQYKLQYLIDTYKIVLPLNIEFRIPDEYVNSTTKRQRQNCLNIRRHMNSIS